MKNSVLLTIFSLLTILLLILHLTTEIAFGLESGGLKNIMGILVVVVWLSGTLLLYERKLGYVIVLVGSLLGTVVPIIHMMGAGLVGGRIGHTHLALFWVFSNFLLGVTALFSVMLSGTFSLLPRVRWRSSAAADLLRANALRCAPPAAPSTSTIRSGW